MKYCLAYDGTPGSQVALDHLVTMLRTTDTLTLYSSVKKSKTDAKTIVRKEEAQRQQEQALATLSHSALPKENVTCTVRTTAEVREDILKYVEEEVPHDVVVLGSRGLGAIQRALHGSVSSYVLNAARKVAVLIVPNRVLSDKGVYLLYADGSPASKQAAEVVGQIMKPDDLLHIVCLYERLDAEVLEGPEGNLVVQAYEQQRNSSKLRAEAVVREAAELVKKSPTVTCTNLTASVVETRDVKEGIVQYAKDKARFTTIVMGSRGLGTFARVCIGSNTNHALYHTNLPILVTHIPA